MRQFAFDSNLRIEIIDVWIFFEYFDGYLRVNFSNGPWLGDIAITFHLSGDTTITTPCDDNFVKGNAQIDVAEDIQLKDALHNPNEPVLPAVIFSDSAM